MYPKRRRFETLKIYKSTILITLVAIIFTIATFAVVPPAYAASSNNFLTSIFNTIFRGNLPSERQINSQQPQQENTAPSVKEIAGISIDSDTFNNLLKRVGNLESQSFSPQSSNALVIDTTGVNLLKNSSFEVGVGGIPTQWSAALDSNTANTFSNGEGVHSGSYGLKFAGGGTGNLGIYQSSTKTVPGRTYTYSAWIKETNVSNATFRLGFWDEQNNKEGTFKNISLSGTRDWFRVSMTITTPGLITDAKNYYPMILIQGLTAGNVYVDDIQLIEGSALTPYNSAQASVGTGGLSLSDLGGGILHSNGSGSITSSTINLNSADVSSTLQVGNGGTGQTSFTSNGILYGNGTNGLSVLGPGTTGYVLQTNGSSVAPSWVSAASIGSAFSSLTGGTNTQAAMVVGTGASLTLSGTGTINANQLNGQTTSVGGALTTGGAFTTSGANALTLTTTGATNLTLPTSGTVTALGNTTTGTGSLVLAASPTLTTPNVGVATATTVNGLTLTANATGFSVAGGTTSKTLTTSNALTLAGTDATTITFQGTDTYVGRTTTDTLTNKTLTAPAINGTVTTTGLTLPAFTASGNITGSGSPAISSFGAINGLTLSAASVTPAAAGVLSVTSNGANALTLDTGGAAGVNIGTTNANAVTLGANTTISANKTLTLSSGTGTITQNYSNTTGSGTTLAITNSNSAAGTSVNGLTINLAGTVPSSGTNTNTGINFGNVTGVASNTFNAITFGTGYTNFVTSPNINVSSAGVITGAGSYNGVSLSATTVQPVSAGVFTFQSNGAFAVTLDTGGAAGVNIGTTNANAVTLGANTTISANKNLTLPSGTGQISQTYSNTAAGNAGLYNITNGNTTVTATAISGLDLTLTNATNTNSSNTLNGITFEAASNNNANIINGINFASVTGYSNFLKTPSIVITSAGNITGAGTVGSGAITDTSSGANALVVGPNGTTNPAFNIDASTVSSATGLNVKSAAAAGGLAVSVISSGAAENLTLDAKGTGTVTINGTATGGITLGKATTITTGGLTVSAGGLTVSAGNVSLTSTVTTGTTTLVGSGASNVNHLVSTQTTLPTESVVTYTAGTVAAGSTDTKGQFTVTTTAATGSVSLVFTGTYASAPICTITPASANTQADASKVYVTSAVGSMTVNYNVAPAANLQTWNYYCIQ